MKLWILIYYIVTPSGVTTGQLDFWSPGECERAKVALANTSKSSWDGPIVEVKGACILRTTP